MFYSCWVFRKTLQHGFTSTRLSSAWRLLDNDWISSSGWTVPLKPLAPIDQQNYIVRILWTKVQIWQRSSHKTTPVNPRGHRLADEISVQLTSSCPLSTETSHNTPHVALTLTCYEVVVLRKLSSFFALSSCYHDVDDMKPAAHLFSLSLWRVRNVSLSQSMSAVNRLKPLRKGNKLSLHREEDF